MTDADPELAPERDEQVAAPEADPVERLAGLVTYLAANLVDEPDTVQVDAERRGQNVHLSLRVPETELGKVIGRQGRIARAMRTALMIAGSRHHVRATLDIEG
ncbi:MAG: KH domain-containing protein [Chloroflexota bacterium]|nr:KH domain-containing protein [Chloroflexota bacterium]